MSYELHVAFVPSRTVRARCARHRKTIRDVPDQDELGPAISAWDTTSFVACDTRAIGSRIALAKYPDVLAELGDPNDEYRDD